MNQKIGIAVIAIVAIALLGFFLFSREQRENQPIKIGALLILSGDGAAWGESAKKGIDLAVEEWKNAHPNQSLEIVYEDTHGEAKQAVTAYQKLVNFDKVDAVIGPLFQTEIAAVAP